MKDVKVKPYRKKFEYSYAMGMFPTIELLRNKPTKIIKILLSDNANKTKELERIIHLCRQNKIPFYFADKLIGKIAKKENTYAVGVFEKYEETLEPRENHLMLINPSDMGNLGTIIRTMIGFGYQNLAVIKPGADIFDPRVVRSSMGALFNLKFEYFDSFEDYTERFEFHNLYPFLIDGKKELSKVNFKKASTLIFGNEGRGLDPKFKEIGQSVFIKQNKDIDSLNLAVSVGVVLHEVFSK
ncbi:TrmH family RNA methyltransferase [Patescibacteria group bacterium]